VRVASARARWFGVTLAVLLLDQLSKSAIRAALAPGESHPLLWDLVSLTFTENQGASFGILQGAGLPISIVSIVALGVFAYVTLFSDVSEKGLLFAIALAAGGIAGNLIDRLAQGAVTDFIDIGFWPVFNVADSAIVVGVAIIVAYLLRSSSRDD